MMNPIGIPPIAQPPVLFPPGSQPVATPPIASPPLGSPPAPLPSPPGMWPNIPGYQPGTPPSDQFTPSGNTSQTEQPDELPSLPVSKNINLADMAFATQLVENTKYGPDLQRLLMPGSGFRADYRGGQVLLAIPPGATPDPTSPGKVRGSDADLVWHVGNQLQQAMGDRYDIQAAIGFCADYFSPDVDNSHIFLLMSPKNNPAEQVIVDPALKKVGRIELLPQYVIRNLKPLSQLTLGGKNFYIPATGYADAIPLGFAEDLMPGTGEVPAKAMLYLTFEMKNGRPAVVLAAQPNPQGPVVADPKIYSHMKPNDVLGQFLNRVQADLNAAFPPAPMTQQVLPAQGTSPFAIPATIPTTTFPNIPAPAPLPPAPGIPLQA